MFNNYHEQFDYMSVDLELKRLKLVVSDVKSQNSELVNILSNMAVTMKEMCSKYDIKLKTKDIEIAILKEKIQQSEKDDSEEENEYLVSNGYEVELKTEKKKEPIQSDVTFAKVNNRDTHNSFPIIPDHALCDKFQLSNNITSKRKNNAEKEPVNMPKTDTPSNDEWTVVSKKQKDPRPSNVPQRKEVPYSSDLEVINGWTYLHLFNVKLGTPDKVVLKYIKSLIGYSDCTVVSLKALGEYASFKICVPVELADTVLKAENWTGNIRIKPWKQNVPPRKIVKKTSTDNSKPNEIDKALVQKPEVTSSSVVTEKLTDLKSNSTVGKKKSKVI